MVGITLSDEEMVEKAYEILAGTREVLNLPNATIPQLKRALEVAEEGKTMLYNYLPSTPDGVVVTDTTVEDLKQKIYDLEHPPKPKKEVIPEFYSGVPGGEVIEKEEPPVEKPKKTKRKRKVK